MGFSILIRWHLYIESRPRSFSPCHSICLFRLLTFQLRLTSVGATRMTSNSTIEQVIQANINEITYSSALLACCWAISPNTSGFPSQMATNAEFISMIWRHHAPSVFFRFISIQRTRRQASEMSGLQLPYQVTPCFQSDKLRWDSSVLTSHKVSNPRDWMLNFHIVLGFGSNTIKTRSICQSD